MYIISGQMNPSEVRFIMKIISQGRDQRLIKFIIPAVQQVVNRVLRYKLLLLELPKVYNCCLECLASRFFKIGQPVCCPCR